MLEPREMTANLARMKQALGLEKLSGEEVRDYLRKMSHSVGPVSTPGAAGREDRRGVGPSTVGGEWGGFGRGWQDRRCELRLAV